VVLFVVHLESKKLDLIAGTIVFISVILGAL